MMLTKAYIPVRRSQIRYYCRVPLYCEMPPGSFQLYKPPGMGISDLRLDEGMHPRWFIQQVDRSEAIREVHRGFNQEIARSIATGDVAGVKATLCNLVTETLSEPRAGMLQALPGTMDVLVSGYSKEPGILRTFHRSQPGS